MSGSGRLWRLLLLLQLLLLVVVAPTHALVPLLEKVQKDLAALTRRVTARHILVSNEEVARALKRKIRQDCLDKEEYIVDVFEKAAQKYSQDETTNGRGGLLGNLVAQGYCRSPELDAACFRLLLGQLEGPLPTEFGYHLVLITERTNCPKLDGDQTKLIQTSSKDVFGTLVPSKQVGKVDFGALVIDQIVFWFLTLLAGGIVAELAEQLASPIL